VLSECFLTSGEGFEKAPPFLVAAGRRFERGARLSHLGDGWSGLGFAMLLEIHLCHFEQRAGPAQSPDGGVRRSFSPSGMKAAIRILSSSYFFS